MIQYLTHEEIDKKKWDRCIELSVNGRVFACSWFLDKMCKGWEGLIEGDYETVFPLTAGRKYGFNYLYQPFFTQQLGIFSVKNLTSEKTGEFLNSIPPEYRYIDIALNASNKLESPVFRTKKNTTFELNLAHDHQKISDSYSENAKRNIRKAETNEVIIRPGDDPDELINLFRKNMGKRLPRIKTVHYGNLHSVMVEGIRNYNGKIYTALDADETLCAGACFLLSNRRFVFLFSANNVESRKNGAMFLLVDRFIRDHSGTDNILDFMGSNNENLARFYKGFGAGENHYLSIRINRLPWPLRMVKR